MYNKNIIGIDIDSLKDGKYTLKILRILKIKGFYRLSSSKKGYHFRIKVNDCSKKDNLMVRYMLGECYGRFKTDLRRLKDGLTEFDILFDMKNKKRSGKWKKI